MRLLSVVGLSLLLLVGPGRAAGPDVIVGFISGGEQYATLPTGEIAITAGTNSCNAGDADLNWRRLPDTRHPVIALNLYQLKDGRFFQLAATWVKHGFFATNETDCTGVAGVPACTPAPAGNALGPGCSDLYGDYLNSNPDYLGPRGSVNPASGQFGADAMTQLPGSPAISDDEKILVVDPLALSDPSARYFMEAHYITEDDTAAGNARNNVTFRELAPHDGDGDFFARYLGPDRRGEPALFAWDGALFSETDSVEQGAHVTIIGASKATLLPNGTYRYDYVLYNMNSDRALASLAIEGVGEVASPTFHAAKTRGEPWDQAPWTLNQQNGAIAWATTPFADDPEANALRWGNAYSFSFISSAGPTQGSATATKFKPGNGEPDTLTLSVLIPSGNT